MTDQADIPQWAMDAAHAAKAAIYASILIPGRDDELEALEAAARIIAGRAPADQSAELPWESILDYDPGLLDDGGGGNVEWWYQYIRDLIASANEYWRDELAALVPADQSAEIEQLEQQRDALLAAAKKCTPETPEEMVARIEAHGPSVTRHKSIPWHGWKALQDAIALAAPTQPQADEEPLLEWTVTENGWEAPSALHDEGVPFMYRIGHHCEDIMWDALGTAAELYPDGYIRVNATLEEVQAWCQDRERELRKAAEQDTSDE